MSIVWKEIGSGGSSNTPAFTLVEEHIISKSFSDSVVTTDAKIYKNNGNESITIKAYCESGIAYIDVKDTYGTSSLERVKLTSTETEYTISLRNPSGDLYEVFTMETLHMEASTVSHMRIINNESI